MWKWSPENCNLQPLYSTVHLKQIRTYIFGIAFGCLRILAKSAFWLRHVHPSVCMYLRGSHWTDCVELYIGDFMTFCRELHMGLKSGKNVGHFS